MKVLAAIPQSLIYLIACIIPKNKSLWVFSAWNGRKFIDNPKYVYKYVLDKEAEINAYWFCKDQFLYREMQHKQLPVIYAYSFDGIIKLLRAGVVVFTHSVEWDFIAYLVGCGVKRVQTWHGMPIKKIGYDDGREKYARLKARIITLLSPYLTDKCHVVIASSEADKSKYCTAFNVREIDIVVTGYPRNDEIFRAVAEKGSKERKKVIYMPTYRGVVGSEFRLFKESSFDFERADFFFKKVGIDFYIKLHPVQIFSSDDLKAIQKSSYIHAIFNENDIYEEIGQYDIVVTDFSGIYFDFMVTGRPIIMAPLNGDDYMEKDRELYYKYEEICPDPPCYSWSEIFDRIETFVDESYVGNSMYTQLQSRFHKYLDAGSSERVVAELKKRYLGVANKVLE